MQVNSRPALRTKSPVISSAVHNTVIPIQAGRCVRWRSVYSFRDRGWTVRIGGNYRSGTKMIHSSAKVQAPKNELNQLFYCFAYFSFFDGFRRYWNSGVAGRWADIPENYLIWSNKKWQSNRTETDGMRRFRHTWWRKYRARYLWHL